MLELSSLQHLEKKLEKANFIIHEIANNEPHITPITTSDCSLFGDFFEQEEKHTYGNSWIYVTQGAYGIGPAKLGYKYYDGKNLCALAIYPKIEDPSTIMLYWIRPLGQGMLPIIVEYAQRIKQRYGICSYVKKLFPEQYDFMLQHGFVSAQQFPWHSSAHSEDDTYPEVIYDRQKTLEAIMGAKKRSRLGNNVRKALKLEKENAIGITPVDFKKKAWKIADIYFSKYNKCWKKSNISSSADYYNMIFDDNCSHCDVEKQILTVNDNPIGFSVLTRDGKFNTTNLYACITLQQKCKYLTDYFFIKMFSFEMTGFINVGGSEDDGINNFKRKYKPFAMRSLRWVSNYLL